MISKCVISRALEDAYRCQNYVDVIAALHSQHPSFAPCRDGQKSLKFTRILLDVCQNEYEALFFTSDRNSPTQKIVGLEAYREKYQHRRRLALIGLFGMLFVQGLLGVKVIERVLHDLIEQCQDALDPFHVEYICHLLGAIGPMLDSSAKGESLLTFVLSRLEHFKHGPMCSRAGISKRGRFMIDNLQSDCRPALCKRVRSMIDKVIEMRTRNSHGESNNEHMDTTLDAKEHESKLQQDVNVRSL